MLSEWLVLARWRVLLLKIVMTCLKRAKARSVKLVLLIYFFYNHMVSQVRCVDPIITNCRNVMSVNFIVKV